MTRLLPFAGHLAAGAAVVVLLTARPCSGDELVARSVEVTPERAESIAAQLDEYARRAAKIVAADDDRTVRMPADRVAARVPEAFAGAASRFLGLPKTGHVIFLTPAAADATEVGAIRALARAIDSSAPAGTSVRCRKLRHLYSEEVATALCDVVGTKGVRAHRETNTLQVQGAAEEIAEIDAILAQIDRPPRRVRMRMAVALVEQASPLNHAIELLAGNPDDPATRSRFAQAMNLAGPESSAEHFDSLVRFLRTRSDCEVFGVGDDLTLLDNRWSQLSVESGRLIIRRPHEVTAAKSGSDDDGVRLGILPTVNSENSVFLEVDLAMPGMPPPPPPPKASSSIASMVTLPTGSVYVIGGLTISSWVTERSGVPLLADLPCVGELFGGTARREVSRNFYAFLQVASAEAPRSLGSRFGERRISTEHGDTTELDPVFAAPELEDDGAPPPR